MQIRGFLGQAAPIALVNAFTDMANRNASQQLIRQPNSGFHWNIPLPHLPPRLRLQAP
jgi:hypothetical protein